MNQNFKSVLKNHALSSVQKVVLLTLIERAGEQEFCCVSHSEIAAGAGVCRSTAARSVIRLIELGLVSVVDAPCPRRSGTRAPVCRLYKLICSPVLATLNEILRLLEEQPR